MPNDIVDNAANIVTIVQYCPGNHRINSFTIPFFSIFLAVIFFTNEKSIRADLYTIKVPINPKFLFCLNKSFYNSEQNAQTFLFLVKTGIFYEFLKHGLSAPRPG